MFALIDCNNFYASCERLFRPDLQNKPIIVLSNNDGCAVARSNEAKALGIGMGEPYFKIKALCHRHNVAVFSSNYALYDDMSTRVMSVIAENWPQLEIYSIDEAFLDLTGLHPSQYTSFCEKLQKQILKNTGIPTSIGIGETKTLAKMANYIAKKQLNVSVFNITTLPYWLDKIAINDVWGVGKRNAAKLAMINIHTAGDLARANKSLIRKRFNVVLQRTAYELGGLSCLSLDEVEPKKSIVSSRSFGSRQTNLNHLQQAVSAHVARAWEKMRKQKLVASYLSVFIYCDRFQENLKLYNKSQGFKLATPTDDLRLLTHHAKTCLNRIFKKNIHYKKVGVLLDGLVPKNSIQADFFEPLEQTKKQHTDNLMNIIEKINHRLKISSRRL